MPTSTALPPRPLLTLPRLKRRSAGEEGQPTKPPRPGPDHPAVRQAASELILQSRALVVRILQMFAILCAAVA